MKHEEEDEQLFALGEAIDAWHETSPPNTNTSGAEQFVQQAEKHLMIRRRNIAILSTTGAVSLCAVAMLFNMNMLPWQGEVEAPAIPNVAVYAVPPVVNPVAVEHARHTPNGVVKPKPSVETITTRIDSFSIPKTASSHPPGMYDTVIEPAKPKENWLEPRLAMLKILRGPPPQVDANLEDPQWDPTSVALGEVTVDVDNISFKASGMTRSLQDVATFLDKLNRSPHFEQVRLIKVRELEEGDTDLKKMFYIEGSWRKTPKK